MSGRPTAEMVAFLRSAGSTHSMREAADRLTELDALSVEIAKRLLTYSTLRPPCPTCGGKKLVDPRTTEDVGLNHCPDCVDGKVSIEQLAATWRAVHNRALIWPYPADGAIDYLRAVRS